MSEKPLVSVVINFLNTEAFLGEAIESVFKQTYENWELLLIDDGSTDGSTNIARKYQKDNPGRVQYIEHEGHVNLGASASRNVGMQRASGKYIAFLDADDIWLPSKLQRQVELLEAKPEIAMVYGPGLWWYSWTSEPEDRERDYMQALGLNPNTLIEPNDLVALFLEDEMAVPSATAVMIRLDVIRKVGGSEDACKSVYDDQVLYAKINLIAPVFVTDVCDYWYRQHPDQRCAVTEKKQAYPVIRLEYLKWLSGYLESQNLGNAKIRQIVKRDIKELTPTFAKRLRKLSGQIFWFFARTTRLFLPAPVRERIWLFLQKSEVSKAK